MEIALVGCGIVAVLTTRLPPAASSFSYAASTGVVGGFPHALVFRVAGRDPKWRFSRDDGFLLAPAEDTTERFPASLSSVVILNAPSVLI